MKKIYNILIILITSISVFAQSPNAGIVPSSVNDRSRIDPSEQLRKSVNPFEVLMTDANSKTMFWDTSHYKEILNLGKVDSIAKSGDTTKFYDRNNNLVGLVLSGGNVKPTKYLSLMDTTCTSWNGWYGYMCQDGVGAILTNIIINGNTYTLNQPLYDNSGNPLADYTALHTAVQNAISSAGYSATVSGFDDGGCYEIDFNLTSGCSTLVIDFNWFDGTNNQTIQGSSTPNATITQIDINTLIDSAQANCPSLTVAKLNSCNVSYLYMFNCSTGAWEVFKTSEIKTAGKTLFVDEVHGNDATAKKGCPTCPFKDPYHAKNSDTYKDGNTIKVEAGKYSMGFIGSGSTTEVPYSPYGLSTNNYNTNVDTFNLHLESGANITFRQSRGIGNPHPAWLGWSTKPKFINITGYGSFNSTNGVLFHHAVTAGSFVMNIDKIETGSSVGEFMNKECVFKIGSILQRGTAVYGGGLFFGPNKNSKQEKPKYSVDIKNWDIDNPLIGGYIPSILVTQTAKWNGETSDGLANASVSANIDNVKMRVNGVGIVGITRYLSDFDSNKISVKINNLDYDNVRNGVFSLGSFYSNASSNSILEFHGEDGGGFISNSKIDIDIANISANKLAIVGSNASYNVYNLKNINVYINSSNAKLNEGCGINLAPTIVLDSTTINITGNWNLTYPILNFNNITLTNGSKIVLKGNFKTDGAYPIVYINNCTISNGSKIILDGNFEGVDKIIQTTGTTTFDANSSIILEGTFKTTSTTIPAIDINHNRLILDKASIITGGGYSVNSSAPINIIVKPGTSSNVTTSASVTQLGSTILVNSNYNN